MGYSDDKISCVLGETPFYEKNKTKNLVLIYFHYMGSLCFLSPFNLAKMAVDSYTTRNTNTHRRRALAHVELCNEIGTIFLSLSLSLVWAYFCIESQYERQTCHEWKAQWHMRVPGVVYRIHAGL